MIGKEQGDEIEPPLSEPTFGFASDGMGGLGRVVFERRTTSRNSSAHRRDGRRANRVNHDNDCHVIVIVIVGVGVGLGGDRSGPCGAGTNLGRGMERSW